MTAELLKLEIFHINRHPSLIDDKQN